MRITVIVDPHIPVPPLSYGGIERIAASLCKGFGQRGHIVDLIAGPDSKPYGGSLRIHQAPTQSRLSRAYRKALFFSLSIITTSRADVIINFGRLDYLLPILLLRTPLIHVQQNPTSDFESDWVLSRRAKQIRLIAVSAAQISQLRDRDRWTVIHNSTRFADLPLMPPPELTEPYLAFLGRITSNKGADTAIRIARRCGLKLKLAGNISNEEGGPEFFEREIRPQLDSRIEWIGPVDDEAKQKLLAGAKALLFPIRWPEPFGIVMVESLACGTPVIATRCASTPEVIEDGVTGFLCDSEEEMVGAISKIDSIDRGYCRKTAEEQFSTETMVAHYLRVVNELLTPPMKSE